MTGAATRLPTGSQAREAVPRSPRNAAVVVHSDCKAWTPSPEGFDALGKKHAAVALALAMALRAIAATRMAADVGRRIAST